MTPSLSLAFAFAVATLCYPGLAILGSGGVAAFFSHPALIALAIITCFLSGAWLLSSGNASPGEREDRANRWVLVVFALIGFLEAYLPAYTDRTGFWTTDGEAIRWLGVALFAGGGALRMWPVFVLSHRFRGVGVLQRGHTLVTDRIFSVVRNPSYLGMLILTFGWALAFRSWVGVLLAVLLIPSLVARIRAKEGLLLRQLGGGYEAYLIRTSRLSPGLY